MTAKQDAPTPPAIPTAGDACAISRNYGDAEERAPYVTARFQEKGNEHGTKV